MPLDWDVIRTVAMDRERKRLGLPSRMELEEARAKQAQAAAESASGIETEAAGRDLTRARIAAMPGEQELDRRYKESVITRNEREPQPRAEPSSLLERIMAMPPEQQAAALRLHRQMNPRSAGEGSGGGQPRTGWQPQYDAATGVLKGYYHPATDTFRSVGEGQLPPGTGGNIPSGEREKRGALQSMLTDVARVKTLVGGEAGKRIGWYTGRWDELKATGAVPFVDPPGDDTIELFHIADNISDMLLRARSGAQINEQEYARLRKITPNPRTSREKFDVDLSRFEIELNNILNARQGKPLNAGGPAEPAPPSGATTTVRTPQDYAALPAGTVYFTPDGKRKKKP